MATDTHETTQYYDRQMMSLLWNNSKIATAEKRKLKLLYDAKKKRATDVAVCSNVVEYAPSPTTPGRLGYGRYYSKPLGIERLEKQIRGTLCRTLYDDVDIVNCHPVLIIQYARRTHNLEMPNLEYYVQNREQVFADLKRDIGLTKDEVKTHILSVMYGGFPPWLFENQPFIKGLDIAPRLFDDIADEIKQLVLVMIATKTHDPLYQALRTDKEKNLNGRFLSLVVQREERHCLNAMIAALAQQGLRADVLAYDGCMVYGQGSVTREVMEHVERHVKAATGYTIKLAVKPQEFYEAGALQETRDQTQQEYQTMKVKWELTHFYFKPANVIGEILPNGEIKYYDLQHAMEAFNTWILHDEEGKEVLFLAQWRRDATRRMIENFVAKMPADCGPTEMSIFKGFEYDRIPVEVTEEDRMKHIAMFENILSAVCGDESIMTLYVRRYFAHIFQKPFERPRVALIFNSHTEGTGKDTLITIIKSLIGPLHFAHYLSAKDFWEKHDTKKAFALVEYLEDCSEQVDRDNLGEMRGRTTAPVVNINPKGKEGYTLPCIARQILTANVPRAVTITDTDRRLNLMQCSTRLVGSNWKEIYAVIQSQAFIKTIGQYLENVPIDEFDPPKFPESEYKKDVKELMMSAEKKFLMECQDEAWLRGDTMSATQLFDLYRQFCTINGLTAVKTSSNFGLKCLPYAGKLFTKTRHMTSGMMYTRVQTE